MGGSRRQVRLEMPENDDMLTLADTSTLATNKINDLHRIRISQGI